MSAETLRLRRARAQVIMVIQPRFANANHLGVLGKFNKIGNSYIQLLMRMVRMSTYGTENIRIFFSYAKQLLKLPHSRAD
jgi:hypothetical protein